MSTSSASCTLDDFDYIHLKMFDIHGVSKGRLVTRKAMNSVLKHGMGMYIGALTYGGVRGEANISEDFAGDAPHNGSVMPIMSTLTPCLKSIRGKFRVGEVLCYALQHDGKLDTTAPRELALSQLKVLKEEFGLIIKSAFEIECKIVDSQTGLNLGHGPSNQVFSSSAVEDNHDLFLDFVEELKEIGVSVDTVLKEESDGEYEFTIDIAEGIETADQVMKFKSASRLFFKKRGYDIVFMTAFKKGCNGFHYNLSLWTPEGKNAFLDLTQRHKFSQMGQHFLAGIIQHGQAMTALVCPTVNCYRRIGAAWAPEYSNWGFDDRYSTFRLKSENGDNVYLENRLPSGACNAYLVMAATLVAGMDGIRRQLALQEPKRKDIEMLLPKDLEAAIDCLQKNRRFTQSLGQLMVDRFIYTKKTFELDVMRSLGPRVSDHERLEKEKDLYYQRV